MEPSPRKNLSAAAAIVLLLVILTAGTVHAQAIASRMTRCRLSIILLLANRRHSSIYIRSCLDHMHAESSEGFWDGCNEHLSGTYQGPCWPWIKDNDCNNVCNKEGDNLSGTCHTFQCRCFTKCDSNCGSC